MKRYFLTPQTTLKWLETPSAYHLVRDELYELDQESFRFLSACTSDEGCASAHSAFIDYCLEEGLLTAAPVRTNRPRVSPSPGPSLRYLELQITDRCNLRCKHCYLGDGSARELPAPQVRSTLRQFEELQGLRVLITGGEPVLHSRFDEINEMLPEFALRKVLVSNGMQLSQDLLNKLKVHEIQVSIDGLQPAHDAIRGAGAWDVVFDALRRAMDAGFEVSVATMITSRNLGDFDALDDLFRSLGVKEWTVDVPCSAGRMTENRQIAVSPESAGKYLGYGYGGGMHSVGKGYACGLHLMAVLPDGNAAKCTFYGDRPVGSIESGLKACWERMRPIRLENLDCDCGYRDACRGGCRYRAELDGTPTGRDPYRCALYGVIDKPEEG